MSQVQVETARAGALLERMETLESVAETLPDSDQRALLQDVIRGTLEDAEPLRAVIVADWLNLSERTVRQWVSAGVLTRKDSNSSRLLIDAARAYQVKHIVDEVREAGKQTNLLDEIFRRLVDATWLEREDLSESLTQLRERKGTLRVRGTDA